VITSTAFLYFSVSNHKYVLTLNLQALSKAKQICAATKMTLGKPITISENEAEVQSGEQQSYARGGAKMMHMMAADAGGGATEVSPGELRLTHTVYITYEIL
jgi:uncharacterized protein YggE